MKNALQEQLQHMKQLPPLELSKRKQLLKKLARCIKQQQAQVVKAIDQDFEHRSAHETLLAEIMVSLDEIHHNIKHMNQWVKPTFNHSNWKFYPSKCAISPQPLVYLMFIFLILPFIRVICFLQPAINYYR